MKAMPLLRATSPFPLHCPRSRLASRPPRCHNAPMRLARPRFRRLLLALLLGLAAWWGVSWWLSVRPLYTLRFPVHEATKQSRQFQSISSFTAQPRHFYVRPLDTAGSHLLISLPTGDGFDPAHWEVRDSATGRLVTTFDLPAQLKKNFPTPAERLDENLRKALDEDRWSTPDGSILLLDNDTPRRQVWQINLLTRERRLLGVLPPAQDVVLSRDGATLLLVDDLPIPGLLALSPQPCLATALLLRQTRLHHLQTPCWRRCRVWSLPDCRERFTTWLPAPIPLDYTPGIITDDGAAVALLDLAPDPASEPNKASANPSQHPPRQHLHVLDTRTGRYNAVPVPYQLRLDSQFSLDSRRPLPGPFVQASEVRDQDLSHTTMRNWVCRLPAGPWFESTGFFYFGNSAPSDAGDGRTRFASSQHETGTVNLHEVAPDGTITTILSRPNTALLNCESLAGSSYFVLTHYAQELQLPEWTPGWIKDLPLLKQALDRKRAWICLTDHTLEKELWRTSFLAQDIFSLLFPGNTRTRLAGNHLVESHEEGDDHVVNILAYPVILWSPWWGRSGGFVVFLAICLLRRRPAKAAPAA